MSFHEMGFQCQIQDFPRGVPTPDPNTNLLFGIICAETAKNKKMAWEGAVHPSS